MAIEKEPLKGKLTNGEPYGQYLGFHKEDIKSAVEWLKKTIINQSIDKDLDMKAVYCHIIDEAFEDVMKK